MSEAIDRDSLRREALHVRDAHDPMKQASGYHRCELCHYTRHPCDAYEMADAVLTLLDEGRTDDPWERRPVSEYTGLAAEQFLKDRSR